MASTSKVTGYSKVRAENPAIMSTIQKAEKRKPLQRTFLEESVPISLAQFSHMASCHLLGRHIVLPHRMKDLY